MLGWKTGNTWKAAFFLLGLGAVSAALVFGPASRKDPLEGAPQIELPTMSHPPPAGETLRIGPLETEPAR